MPLIIGHFVKEYANGACIITSSYDIFDELSDEIWSGHPVSRVTLEQPTFDEMKECIKTEVDSIKDEECKRILENEFVTGRIDPFLGVVEDTFAR